MLSFLSLSLLMTNAIWRKPEGLYKPRRERGEKLGSREESAKRV